jgi:hypothetical protein
MGEVSAELLSQIVFVLRKLSLDFRFLFFLA